MPETAEYFPRSINCSRSIRIPVAADLVWEVVGDIASPVPGGGAIERIEVQGAGEGAIRTFHLTGGATITERIETHDASDRRYTYRIIDSGPLPYTRYLGAAEVTPAGPDACVLSWAAMADPVEADTDILRPALEANLDSALQAVAAHFRMKL